ncbi:MAG: inositol monophosphatase [Pseudomonadota bacterium]
MTFDDASKTALIEAVRAATRAEIVPRFRRLGAADLKTKSSAQDIVTEADTGAEARIRAAVAEILPGARIIGEEGVAANPAELDGISEPGLTVVVDPVDGTWNFARGLAVFGTILSVIDSGETVFGLLYDPVLDDWIEAELGSGAWYVAGGERRRLTLPPPPTRAEMTGLHAAYGLYAATWQACTARHASFGLVTQTRASLWDYRLLVTGGAGFCLNHHLNVWDHAAGVLALQEAGGHAALLGGERYRPAMRSGHLLCAGSEALWHEVAETFAPVILPQK